MLLFLLKTLIIIKFKLKEKNKIKLIKKLYFMKHVYIRNAKKNHVHIRSMERNIFYTNFHNSY
jgi:hypothetical protein